MDPFEEAAQIVRRRDPDRYFADLFAPEPARRHLLALHAFSAETARVRDAVSQPLPGEMRLQWWRDVLAAGEGGGHPVAAVLVEVIRVHRLPFAAFDNLLSARTFDLYDEPMPDGATFEGYAGDTVSALFQLAAIILAGGDPGSAEAAGHAGVTYAITGHLRAFAFHASRRQLFLPADRFLAAGASLADVFAGRTSPALLAALGELRALARRHLAEARAHLVALPAAARLAFLPLALVEPYLARMERPGYAPFTTPVELPQWRRQWLLWRAARRG